MSLRVRILGAVLAGAWLAVPAGADEPAKKPAQPSVEVVFCLDTTGSMGGLINAAKQKIWAISNQISSGTPTPKVKVGLVAYRDRRDAYVTKIFDLTDDLDAIHGHLMGFQAQGGGDRPESVNQALNEAVTKMTWSNDKKTLKLIFLVGDAPPHMDYPDDVKYPETCKLAVARDIIINTVQCGPSPDTRKFWEEICRLGEGSYVQIDQKGGPIVAVTTPFDADLAKINRELTATTLTYGNRQTQSEGLAKKAANATLAPGIAADRAAFYARNAAGGTAYDLLTNIQQGKVQLDKLTKDELPAELKNLSLPEQKAYLEKLETRRKELSEQAISLDRKRSQFIAQKQAEDNRNRARDRFDNQVLRILQRQAGRSNLIQYGTAEENKK
jgi:Mg-chelatase subunit ChlD